MKHPVGDVVIIYQVKDLGLVNIPRVGQGMKDAIRVHGIVLPVTRIEAFLRKTSDGIFAVGSQAGKNAVFPVVKGFLYSLQID
jgi:hypothetical protein